MHYLITDKAENFDHHMHTKQGQNFMQGKLLHGTTSNFVFSCSAHIVQLLINANKNARYAKEAKRIDKLQHSLYGLCM